MKLGRKLLATVLATATVLGTFVMQGTVASADGENVGGEKEQSEWTNPFGDVDDSDWFVKNVEFVNTHALFNGVAPTEFGPNLSMNRAMFCTVMARIEGVKLDSYTTTGFADVDMREYYGPSVSWAAQMGIVNGVTATTFEPLTNISREQMCVMLDRYLELHNMQVEDNGMVFVDASSVSDYAKTAVTVCKNLGFVNGTKTDDVIYFNPLQTATRAEVAAIFQRFCEYFNMPYPGAIEITDILMDVNAAGLTSMYNTLVSLRDDCTKLGLTTTYEDSAITTIQMHLGYLQQDQEVNTHEKIPKSRIESLNKLYFKTLHSLITYKYGIAKPMQVTTYDAATIRVDSNNLVACYQDGSEEPVYPIGFGHWMGTISQSISNFDSLGLTVVQVEIGPNSVIVPKGQGSHDGLTDDDMFDITTDRITGEVLDFLDLAEQSNVAVCLLLSPHYFPSFLYDMYPDLGIKNKNGNYDGYHVGHPVAKRVEELFLRTIIPLVDDKTSLFSYCLSNEPMYFSNQESYNNYELPAFHAYLKKQFSTVENMNATLGTKCNDFESVMFPESVAKDGGLYYVYVRFNNQFFSDWHKWMAEIIAEYSALPVHAKVSGWLNWIPGRGVMQEDYFESFSGIMGCDSFNFIDGNRYEQQLWYTYLSSITDKPIYNSEDHMSPEGDKGDDPEYDVDGLASHVYMDLIEGAINGRSCSTIWTWYPLRNDPVYGMIGNISDRPMNMNAVSTASFDLMRLHNEVAAFNDADSTIWILSSQTEMIYGEGWHAYDALMFAYKCAIESGKKVGIITEGTVDKLGEGDILLVPATEHVTDQCAKDLAAYAKSGKGEIVLMNTKYQDGTVNDCIRKNEYNFNIDNETYNTIVSNAKTYAWFWDADSDNVNTDEVQQREVRNFTGWMRGNLALDVRLNYGSYNYITNGVSYYAIEYNGKILLKATNYSVDSEVKNISITYQGKKISRYTDLLTGKCYTLGNGITLGKSGVAILEFDPS